MSAPSSKVAVLGASGLIWQAVAASLMESGFEVVAVARRFTPAQKAAFASIVETPIVDLEPEDLSRLLSERGVDVVVNCVGVLQDSRRGGSADEAHRGLVERLVAALRSAGGERLLVHLSIPGDDEDDRTPFSATKREAEHLIAAGSIPFIVLRPGFVVAPAAYGGSALIRALAALPVELPDREGARPFAVTDAADIVRTLKFVAGRWAEGERDWSAIWDVMARRPTTVGEVIGAFRRHLGGPSWRLRLPAWTMKLGARAGDLAVSLGWSPPIRTTALAEMRRGVSGDPGPWIDATGIEPTPLGTILSRASASVQEKWFARLYLTKALALATLVVFWIASGLIALTVAFDAAAAILTAHGFALEVAQAITIVSSLADILVGLAIAFRRSCRAGLIAGIALSLAYMASAALVTPALWLEPLGALVKTGPAIVLMLVALAILDER